MNAMRATFHKKAIQEAQRRGISNTIISRALGVSSERVRQISPGGGRARISRPTGPRKPLKCKGCGVIKWVTPALYKHKSYCSTACNGRHHRKLTSDRDLVNIISRRHAGETWTDISRSYKLPQQNIQRRLWMFLHERGALTRDKVEGIWMKNLDSAYFGRRKGGWSWLVKQTGLSPS